MDINGQISIEFTLFIGFILILVVGILSSVGDDVELVNIMSSARNGALDGANIDSFAIYPEDSFNNSYEIHPRILNPSQVKIINITYKIFGYDAIYNKTKIQIHITASCPTVNDVDKNPLGDRINFYARKRICESFGTSSQTYPEYNPAFSKKYFITTAEVKWIR